LLHYHAEQSGFANAVQTWLEERFSFATHERMPVYGYAYKKACHKHITRRGNLVYFVRELRGFHSFNSLVGGDEELAALYAITFEGQGLNIRAEKVLSRLYAALLMAMTLVSGVVAILSRLRLRIVPRPSFLAADRLVDPRDQGILDEVRRQGRAVLYISRSSDLREELRNARIPDELIVDRGSGRIPLSDAGTIGWDFLSDWCRLARVAWGLHPRLVFELTSLPYHRVLIRADLRHYPCEYFYARDEYNTEHILRTHELRQLGARSIGLMHAVPILGRAAFGWAYVSFDTFFVSGAWIINEFGSRWPPDMNTRAAGCPGYTSERLRAMRPLMERPADILFFVSWVPNLDLVERMIDRVCADHPGRTIWMKIKPAWRDRPALDSLRRRVKRHANLRETQEPSLDLMGRARYAISPPSTVVSEALQSGLAVFCIDDRSWGHRLCFRSFPINVATPDELAGRLGALERGDPYPFAEVEPLVPRDGTNYHDALLRELGLTTHFSDRKPAAA
jgi:hypothetical protein